jgi:hypothetical protein
MGGSFSKWNAQLAAAGDARRIEEMKTERGIRFPSPGETLTSVPDFDNAGDAMTYMSKLTEPQIKQIKDIKFRVGGRMPMTVVERMTLSPVNFDSLTKLTTSGALQRVFKGIKDPEGLTELIGAARGGMIHSRKEGGPILPARPQVMGQQHSKRVGF